MKIYILIVLTTLFNMHLLHGQNAKDRPSSTLDDLAFAWRPSGDSIDLMAYNKLYAPIELILFDRATNVELKSILLPALDSVAVLRRKVANLDSIKTEISHLIRVAYYIGHPAHIHPNEDYLYRLPFKKGKKYEVGQGWNGKKTHHDKASKYALDFTMPVGTPVFSAREGRVIKAIDWFSKQGGVELKNAANKVIIMHDDGTLAVYAHLQYQGVSVKEGEWVDRGQLLGLSGLTGYTNGPHLHFVVRKGRDEAIPIYFRGYEGRPLKRGKTYKTKE